MFTLESINRLHEQLAASNSTTSNGDDHETDAAADTPAAAGQPTPHEPRLPGPGVAGPAPDAPPDSSDGLSDDLPGSPVERLLWHLRGTDPVLFKDPQDRAYISVKDRGHRELFEINSDAFRRWLSNRAYTVSRYFPGDETVKHALQVQTALAEASGHVFEVHLRVARLKDRLFLDLADQERRVVEVEPGGWRLLPGDPPVYFRRPRGLLPLPVPVPGGDLAELRQILNLDNERNYRLAIAWLLGALYPPGPFPVLVLTGPEGSAKSNTARGLRFLIDPHKVQTLSRPRNEESLLLTANSNWVVSLDNLSEVPPWLSDPLCRISTGAGDVKRQLYTDDGLVISYVSRPVILNGIPDSMISRPDLLSRSLMAHLPAITDATRRTEEEVWRLLQDARPRILGALLSAAAEGLKNLPTTRLPSLPRLADLAVWVEASSPALGWQPGEFVDLLRVEREHHDAQTLSVWSIYPSLEQLICKAPGRCYKSTVGGLLAGLGKVLEFKDRPRDWPANAKALSAELSRHEELLRRAGFTIDWLPKSNRGRQILICAGGDAAVPGSSPCQRQAG
jgi:hypothetical protein